jgi:hypothetical protein
MQSGPPDSQQESVLHTPDCQNVLEGLTRYVRLVLEVSSRGCRNVNLLQIAHFVLEIISTRNKKCSRILTSVSDSSTVEI